MRRAAAVLLAVVFVLLAGCRHGHRPETAAVPSGPSSGAVGVSYSFSSSAEDRDGDDVAIRFDWGDGDTSEWSPWVRAGDTVSIGHTWLVPGTFNVKAQAKARSFTMSNWSDGRTTVIVGRWTRTFGGTEEDYGSWVQKTRDGGYILTGYTCSYGAGGRDVWLVKTDANGNEVWGKTFGGTSWESGYSVTQTQDGGYVVVGRGRTDTWYPWLIKTDAAGNRVWDRSFARFFDGEAHSVTQTQDGGCMVVGYTYTHAGGQDVLLIKTDAAGDTAWTRTFDRTEYDNANSVQQTQDGGYVVAGCAESWSAGKGDIWLIKTDVDGNKTWDKVFGGALYDCAYSVQQTGDGGYVITGRTDSYGAGSRDVWLIKTNASGDSVWARTFGGEGEDQGFAVLQTRDGGYIITGCTYSYGAGNGDVWLIKTDVGGNEVWSTTFGGSNPDWGCSVQLTPDGGYLIGGTTWSYGAGVADVWLIKTDAEGRVDEGGGK